jgi:hypothetical protein
MKLERRIAEALKIAAQPDGAHHKDWIIDQMVRALTGDGYAQWVADRKIGADGPDTYRWDIGIAP